MLMSRIMKSIAVSVDFMSFVITVFQTRSLQGLSIPLDLSVDRLRTKYQDASSLTTYSISKGLIRLLDLL